MLSQALHAEGYCRLEHVLSPAWPKPISYPKRYNSKQVRSRMRRSPATSPTDVPTSCIIPVSIHLSLFQDKHSNGYNTVDLNWGSKPFRSGMATTEKSTTAGAKGLAAPPPSIFATGRSDRRITMIAGPVNSRTTCSIGQTRCVCGRTSSRTLTLKAMRIRSIFAQTYRHVGHMA